METYPQPHGSVYWEAFFRRIRLEEADPYPEGKNRRDLDQHRG